MGFFTLDSNRDYGWRLSFRETDTRKLKNLQIYSCGSILTTGTHERDGDVQEPEHEPGMITHLKEVKSVLASGNRNP